MFKSYLFAVLSLICVVSTGQTKSGRTAYMSEDKLIRVNVTPGRSTILSFPSKPTKVILGNSGLFAVEYVESDLALAALQAPARSNLFVYLRGRRYGFDLGTVSSGGDDVLFIRDGKSRKLKVRIKND